MTDSTADSVSPGEGEERAPAHEGSPGTDTPRAGGPKGSPRSERGWKLVSYAIRGGLAVLVLLIGFAVFGLLASQRTAPAEAPRGNGAIVVETVRAEARSVRRPWRGFGTARAMDAADVAPEVTGRVIERGPEIEPGLAVTSGQVLFRLDPHDFEQRVATAEQRVAQLEADLEGLGREEARLNEQVALAAQEAAIAQRDYERVLEADADGVGSPGGNDASLRAKLIADRALAALRSQLDQIPTRRASLEAGLASERASLSLARRDLERTVITAPVGGVLQSVVPEVGEWVTAGQPAARIVDLSTLEIPLRVPASAAGSIRTGDEAEVASEGLALLGWSGRVARVAPEADENSRTMTLFIEVDQSDSEGDALLRPGQFVTSRVLSRDEEPRLLVPRRAILDDRIMVARASDGGEGLATVVPVSVRMLYSLRGQFPELSPDETEWAALAIGNGLRAGDRVIVSNLEQLRSGMLVDPRDATDPSGASPTVEVEPGVRAGGGG